MSFVLASARRETSGTAAAASSRNLNCQSVSRSLVSARFSGFFGFGSRPLLRVVTVSGRGVRGVAGRPHGCRSFQICCPSAIKLCDPKCQGNAINFLDLNWTPAQIATY